jgi:hypothetical protein
MQERTSVQRHTTRAIAAAVLHGEGIEIGAFINRPLAL